MQITKLNSSSAHDNRYMKTKTRIHSDKVYISFHGLNESDYGVECEFFTIISIDSLPVYKNKNYRQVHLDNCAYKIVVD